MKIAVLLPCHNEALTVQAIIAGFRAALPESEVWVCDNVSVDGTATLAEAAGANVVDEPRLGKGNAVRRLFADVEADIYVMADGDSTYDPASAQAMIDLLVCGRMDMVVGNRLHARGDGQFRPGHHFGNRMFAGVLRTFFGSSIADPLSGYRVLSRRFVKSFPAESRGFEIEIELAVAAFEHRCAVGELEVPYRPRPAGSDSKLSTVRDGLRILRTVLLLLRDVRPLEFFGTMSGMLAVVGSGLFYPILHTYLEVHRVPRFPTLIGVTGLFVLSIVFFTCGVILDRVAAVRRFQHRLSYLHRPGPTKIRPGTEGVASGFQAERKGLRAGGEYVP